MDSFQLLDFNELCLLNLFVLEQLLPLLEYVLPHDHRLFEI